MGSAAIVAAYAVWGIGLAVGRLVAAGAMLLYFLVVVAATARMKRSLAATREAARHLAQDERMDELGPLLHAMYFVGRDHQPSLRATLTSMLGTAARSGRIDLDDAGVSALRCHIRTATRVHGPSFDPEFAVAGLKVLAKVGNERSLRCVATIAARQPTTPEERRIQEGAQACVAQLRERLARPDPRHHLLRPSSVSCSLGRLLRPSARAAAPPDQLPRASAPGPRPAPQADAPSDRVREVDTRPGR